MNIFRLIFLFLIGLFVRRLFFKSTRKAPNASRSEDTFRSTGNKSAPGQSESLREITEQEIDDADFEEIP